jgi:hypothetical protein
VISVEYYPDRKLCPNNLVVLRESIHEHLKVKYGKRGGIIMTRSYYVKTPPTVPTLLNLQDADVKASIQYIMALDAYKEDVKAVNRSNVAGLDERASIFGDIYSAIKQSARDQMATDVRYAGLITNAYDPV